MNSFRPGIAISLATALFCGSVLIQALESHAEEVTAQQVRDSIERAVNFLKRQQNQNGKWSEFANNPGGLTCLCTLALLNAGVPLDDDSMQRALRAVREIEPSRTYVVALQTMVLCAAEPAKDAQLIARNVRWLESHQNKEGGKKGSWT